LKLAVPGDRFNTGITLLRGSARRFIEIEAAAVNGGGVDAFARFVSVVD